MRVFVVAVGHDWSRAATFLAGGGGVVGAGGGAVDGLLHVAVALENSFGGEICTAGEEGRIVQDGLQVAGHFAHGLVAFYERVHGFDGQEAVFHLFQFGTREENVGCDNGREVMDVHFRSRLIIDHRKRRGPVEKASKHLPCISMAFW